MTITEKKEALDGAATPTKANEYLPTSNSVKEHTRMYVHLTKPGASTGDHTVTWAGEKFDRRESMNVVISPEDALVLNRAPREVTICPDCFRARREFHDQMTKNEIMRRRRNEEEEHVAALVEAHRAGNTIDVVHHLDHLVAMDDEDLAEAGLTSWDEEGK